MNYAGSSSHEGVFLLLRRIPLSQLFSISPLTLLLLLLSFTLLKPIFSFQTLPSFFFHSKSCLPPKKTASLPPRLLHAAPLGSPRFSSPAPC